jgi:preprotein translocase subunit SecG
MTIAIVALHVIVCLFLIVVILLQAGRGQGLSWGSFGGNPQSILGTKTAGFLTKLTTTCAIIFLLTCIGLNIIETRKARSLLAPTRPLSQVDFEKIKEALEQAQLTPEQAAEQMGLTITPEQLAEQVEHTAETVVPEVAVPAEQAPE